NQQPSKTRHSNCEDNDVDLFNYETFEEAFTGLADNSSTITTTQDVLPRNGVAEARRRGRGRGEQRLAP
ncbi:MAG: hypothetical protein ACYS7M_05670, partial [Planctomycetota bacterium]